MYFIAEMSANHNQHLATAKDIILAASAVGANAVKVQVYTPDSLVVNDGRKIEGGLWDGLTYLELYEKAMMPWEWVKELKEFAEILGMDFIGTPYCKKSLKYLKDNGVKHYKVASMEAYDPYFTDEVINTALEMGGMCYISRNSNKAPIYRQAGNIIMLNCVSEYPSGHYRKNDLHGRPWGLSDHSTNNIAAIMATFEGACVIEKHMKLSKTRINGYGFDYDFSLTPAQFDKMVKTVKEAERMLKDKEDYNPLKYARCLRAVEDIKKGEMFTYDNVKPMRPGGGMSVFEYEDIIGTNAEKNYIKGDAL